MSQVLITAAFMFLFHFPSTLMAEFKVESDKENVVSSRLEGRWQFNEAISSRLRTRLPLNRDRAMEFHADDKIVAKIPDKYGKFLKRKTIYMAGIMKSGKNDYPFILTEHKGNPHIVIFRERDGDPLGDKGVNSYKGFYDDALALMKSKELKAFDLADESEKQRETYGNNSFGQGCLLARRLVGSGVRFVEVKHDGWDHHKALADEMSEVAPVFDQAFATLITDLEQRGMLDSTLVVVATEFGRKPAFDGDGRSHHPVCFSTVLAGGGTKAGFVYGKSDDMGYYVDENAVSVGAFHASIAFAAGMEIEKPATSPSGRPMTVGDGEKPIMDLFA